MTTWTRAPILALFLFAGMSAAAAQPVPEAFYGQVASHWMARNASGISASFAPMVELNLGDGSVAGTYEREQAANVLSGYLRSITPQPATKIVAQRPTYMCLSHVYTDSSGASKSTKLWFTVRSEGSGWVITGIKR